MFSNQTVLFLRNLAEHNEKPWFEANKDRYVTHVKDAAASFSEALCPILASRYDIDVTAKLFRIHRDLRFSKDKTPYNTHVHMSFADGPSGAAWMLGLERDRLVLGYGLFAFSKAQLENWRSAVAGAAGTQLMEVLEEAKRKGVRLEQPELKRVPAPHAQDHANGQLLRRKGITFWLDIRSKDYAFGPSAPARIANAFAVFDPLRKGLSSALSPAGY